MQKFLLGLVLSLSISLSFGQYIIRGGLDEEYSGIIELQNNDYLFVGSTESYGSGNSDLLIIRFSPNFNILWQKTFGGSDLETLISSKGIIENTDGSVSIRAITSSYGAGDNDFLLMNINASNGNLNWAKTYGGANEERGYAFDKTLDGGFLLGGDTKSFTGTGRKLYILKTDAAGNLQWTKILGLNSVEATAITDLIELSNQEILICGSTDVPSSSSSFISKLDAQGNLVWTKIYGQTAGGLNGQEGINGLTEKPNGNIIATGMTRNLAELGGTYDALTMEINSSNGDVIWAKVYGGNDFDFAYHSIIDNDGNYIIPFYQRSFGFGNFDMSLVKLDDNGNILKAKSFGSNAYEIGRSVNLCNDGGLISSYFTEGFNASGRDAVIVRTNSCWNNDCNELEIPLKSKSININTQSYTFSESSGGVEEDITISNAASSVVMDTICSQIPSQLIACDSIDTIQTTPIENNTCLSSPNAFSPNGDDLNDNFYPIFKNDFVEIKEFRIYNRWGEEVHNGNFPWDGKYKNQEQAIETYAYFIKYTCNNEEKRLIGNVTLIR